MFLPLTDPLAATFNKRGAPSSRKCVADLGIMMRNSSKAFQTFWSHFFVFTLEKQHKNLNIWCVLTSNRRFGGYIQ